MVVTIQQVLRPFLIMSFIMGLGVYPMRQPNPSIRCIEYLSILYCLTIWFSYIYLFYYALVLFFCKTLCAHTLYVIILAINIFTAITSALMNFYHQKKFEISLKKLSTVDDSLEELGIPKTYQKIQTCSKLVIIAWIVYSLVKNFGDTIWFPKIKEIFPWKLFLIHIINHSVHVNAFADLLFIFLLWYVSTRFDKVNEHMQYSLIREDHGLKLTNKKSVVAPHRFTLCTDYKQTLWTSMHLHLELCRIVRQLNIMFGTQITFGMATYLIQLTLMCYGLCIMTMQKLPTETFPSPVFWWSAIYPCFILLIRVYAVNFMCERVMDKANQIDKIIHQLTTFQYADVCQEIYQFALQVMHHPLKLTGMNLFYLGNECLRKFNLTIVTYVIIMAQMKIRLT